MGRNIGKKMGFGKLTVPLGTELTVPSGTEINDFFKESPVRD
jgi:hypothetical protein